MLIGMVSGQRRIKPQGFLGEGGRTGLDLNSSRLTGTSKRETVTECIEKASC